MSRSAGVDDLVERLFGEQSGLATADQLRTCGLTPAGLRWRLERDWRRVLPRVVAAGRSPLTDHQRLVAALLFAGEGAVVAGPTAALWHGVRSAAIDRRVHVTIPATRCIRSQGVVLVHRTRRPDASAWHRGVLVVSSPARAVADAARDVGESDARRLVIEALQRRLVSAAGLRHELLAGPRAGAAVLARALAEAEQGAWSIPEADLARIVARSALLPPMWANPRLTLGARRLPTPDGWFDDVGLAVQVHSRQYHAGDLDWEATVGADAELVEHGIPVLAVTPRQIARSQDDVLARLERAHAAARLRPRPAVIATPIVPA
jgi:hypothetical protein